jgi:hypothetical protein
VLLLQKGDANGNMEEENRGSKWNFDVSGDHQGSRNSVYAASFLQPPPPQHTHTTNPLNLFILESVAPRAGLYDCLLFSAMLK